jgi:hypothetical protein
MSYICTTCDRAFKYPSHLKKHLFNRKKQCIKKNGLPKIYVCEYCSSEFKHHQSYYRHINHVCKLVPKDIKKPDTVVPVSQHLDQSITNNNTTNTNTNTNTGNDNRQINITINICGSEVPADILASITCLDEESMEILREYIPKLIRPFGQENIGAIEDKRIINYYNKMPDITYRNLLNDIYLLDENRNMAIPNVKHAIVQYIKDDFTISHTDRDSHIESIQRQMHHVYSLLFQKYESKIRLYFRGQHEIFIENARREHKDVVFDFNKKEDARIAEKLRQLKQEAEEKSEIYDERSILNDNPVVCDIPDYKTITRQIIEDYLKSNSKHNVKTMSEHHDRITAIKYHIHEQKPIRKAKKVLTLSDLIEERAFAERHKQSLEKVMQLDKDYGIVPPQDSSVSSDDSSSEMDEIDRLEALRGES